ncbi:MAG: Fic family protein, partial [Opitutaceae bacterium]|nr:Fic family protein [Opitutaceae bacterium]
RERIDVLFADILGADETGSEAVASAKAAALTRQCNVSELVKDRELLERLTINLTYHSNATEGSSMSERDVEEVIFGNKVLKNRTAVEQREAINHKTALNFLLDELQSLGVAFAFTPDLLRAAHLRLMNGIIANAGEYRDHGARIRSVFVPLANFIRIPELVKVLCERMSVETADPIGLLATSHAEFERIHPFSDGNGRAGRLLLFVKALQLGLVPPVINKERRGAYYKYLEICQTKGVSGPLEKFIAEAIIETSGRFGE